MCNTYFVYSYRPFVVINIINAAAAILVVINSYFFRLEDAVFLPSAEPPARWLGSLLLTVPEGRPSAFSSLCVAFAAVTATAVAVTAVVGVGGSD